jgi:predicted transcriptional regulator
MARYGVTMMKQEGVPAEEIREHLEHMQERGLLPDLEIEVVLEA